MLEETVLPVCVPTWSALSSSRMQDITNCGLGYLKMPSWKFTDYHLWRSALAVWMMVSWYNPIVAHSFLSFAIGVTYQAEAFQSIRNFYTNDSVTSKTTCNLNIHVLCVYQNNYSMKFHFIPLNDCLQLMFWMDKSTFIFTLH